MLKQKLLFAATSLLALLLVSTSAQAQYDDMYYDPDEFRSVEPAPDYYQEDYAERSDAPRDNAFRSSSSYADDYYDYAYSSRIRRFNRPYAGFGYYDPVYVDVAYYDPFFRPFGTTSLIYNSGFGYNRFNRFGRGAFLEPVITPYGVAYVDRGFGGWNRGFGWNDPFYGNAWGGGGFGRGYYGAGAWGGGGFGGGGFVTPGGYYCPPAWGGGNTYVVNNNVNNAPARRTVTSVPRAATTSIADRVARNRGNTTVTPRSLDNRGTTATRSSSGRTVRSADRGSNTRIDRSRTTVTPRSATQSRTYSPSRSATRTRTYTPSRSTTPTRSSATPSRSTTPRSYSPSRSTTPTRSYSPSRSTSPTRSYTPSRSSSPTRSYSPSSSSSSRSSGSTRSTTTTRSTTRGGGRGGR